MDYPVVIHVTLIVPASFHVPGEEALQQRVETFCDSVLPALKTTMRHLTEQEVVVHAEMFGQLVVQRQPQHMDS
jgi:hypothetical protein